MRSEEAKEGRKTDGGRLISARAEMCEETSCTYLLLTAPARVEWKENLLLLAYYSRH